MKLYALLIGINDYHDESIPPVPPLNACLNDVAAMRALLLNHYKDIIGDDGQIMTLTNEQATKANVIDGFRKHLTQAQEGDVALVFYAGHGSSNITAPQFQQYTHDKEEQTWVLYDSRTAQKGPFGEGGLDLADKEIALLIEEVGQTRAHIVVVSDSCHSGSVTREVEDFMNLRQRSIMGTNEERTLESYLNGAYLRRPDLTIPHTKHILLAACERVEKAREGVDNHGVFTKALLDVLEKTGGQLQYSDLFIQVRAAIQGFVKNQTPQVEAHFGFNPRQGFLGRKVAEGRFKRYRIRFDKTPQPGRWKIDLGAAMGIQSDLGSPIPIRVFDAVSEGKLIGEAHLGTLNVTESDILGKDVLTDTYAVYWGEPVALPLSPLFVYGDTDVFSLMKKAFDETSESGIYLHDKREVCRFELKISNGNILMYDTQSNIMVQGVEGTSALSVDWALKILNHLARWHRTLELQNKKSKLKPAEVGLKMVINAGEGNETAFTDSTITLEFDGENRIPFKAVFNNKTKIPLHIQLLYQTPQYGIIPFYTDSQSIKSGSPEITLYENNFYLEDGVDEETDTLKLIVSTNKIDNDVFGLDDLAIGEILKPERDRAIAYGSRAIGGSEPDWLTKTITIRIIRKSKNTIGNANIDLGNGITLQGHSKVTAILNKVPLIPKTRGIDTLPISHPYFTKNDYNFEIVNLAAGTRGDDESIIELSDIKNIESLETQPLELLIDFKHTEGGNKEHGQELILPFVFDGDDFLPFGRTEITEKGHIKCSLIHIPEDKALVKTRSFGSAMRLVFIKFTNKLGFDGETQQLQWVDYDDEATRKSEGLEAKVKESKKVLLLVHGIIGDTKDMAKPFKMALDSHSYDLVMTFDYENLNTLIEDNARVLKEKLLKLGFGEGDDKKLTIVAHSMGGLVSRYMIEHLGGDKLVDKLVMAGTPNGGSKFGDIPAYLNWLTALLGMGTKIFPNVLTGIASMFLKLTKETLLISLEEMKPTSSFILNLAQGTPTQVPYIVLGGSLDKYLKNDAQAKDFMDKAAVQAGGWVYKNEPNDIAVSVQGIFSVQALEKRELACHHLNYFVIPESLEALKKAIGC